MGGGILPYMVPRKLLDLELRPLLRALRGRLKDRPQLTVEGKDRHRVYKRAGATFLELEFRRDHMRLDLFLPEAERKQARSSGIARAHPFKPAEAIRVRFDRAEDLPQVSRWLEAAYQRAASAAPVLRLEHSSTEPEVRAKATRVRPKTVRHTATGSSA